MMSRPEISQQVQRKVLVLKSLMFKNSKVKRLQNIKKSIEITENIQKNADG